MGVFCVQNGARLQSPLNLLEKSYVIIYNVVGEVACYVSAYVSGVY